MDPRTSHGWMDASWMDGSWMDGSWMGGWCPTPGEEVFISLTHATGKIDVEFMSSNLILFVESDLPSGR